MKSQGKCTVSVVMCTYNGEKYLREQLDSIIGQTYPIDELIIQDDGSSDSTPAIVGEYCQNYPYIQFYQNEQRKGVVDNFISAILRSKGDCIALSDQDDVWRPEKITTLVECMGKENKALIYSGYRTVNSQGEEMGDVGLKKMEAESLFDLIFNGNVVTGCTCMVDKKIKSMLLPSPRSFFLHDHWLALLAYNNGGLYFCREKLVDYRHHESNVIASLGGGGKKVFDARYFRMKAADLWLLFRSGNKLKSSFKIQLFLLGQILLCCSGASWIKKRLSGV